MITIVTSKRGERGMRCHIEACGDTSHVVVENVLYRNYGFPDGGLASNYTLAQARCHAQGILDEGGKIEEWDTDVAELIGLRRPAELEPAHAD